MLDDIALDVRAGEALALLGANGAGKTTLRKILATIHRPSRGTVSVAGFDAVREVDEVRRRVGLVAHGSHLYDELTAAENLAFWAALSGNAARRDDVAAALAAVDLDHVAGERVRTFSAGMKRRLSLARVAFQRPLVLLLDEPFASLDQQAKKWLEEYLQSFKAQGGAIVMTTHSFGRELAVADRVAMLAGGRIAVDTARAGLSAEDIQALYTLHVEDAG